MASTSFNAAGHSARWGKRAAIAGAVAAAAALAYFNPFPLLHLELARHWNRATAEVPAVPPRLSGYVAVIEARPIRELENNLSGLTFNPHSGTLFGVINRPAEVVEISTEGKLLRKLPLAGIKDAEGITHVEGEHFIVSDEADNSLHEVRIGPHDAGPVATTRHELQTGFRHLHNMGFEGLSWDETRGELLVINEKWPRRVLAVRGLAGPAPRIREWRIADPLGLPGSDLSSLTVHSRTGNLLLLLEELAVIVEYTRDGRLAGTLPLWPGMHGLKRKVPQPEGITLGPDGAIYVVSEPNLLYKFVQLKRPRGD